MGMGAWPDSRVVRHSSSESADFPQKCKTVFDDETYLEKRLGIILDGNLHSFSLRIFLVFGKKIGFQAGEHFGPQMSYFELKK